MAFYIWSGWFCSGIFTRIDGCECSFLKKKIIYIYRYIFIIEVNPKK